MGKKTTAPAKAPRTAAPSGDHDNDGKMGGSLTQAAADAQAEPAPTSEPAPAPAPAPEPAPDLEPAGDPTPGEPGAFHPEFGNATQLVQDLAEYIKVTHNMLRWRGRLFAGEDVIPRTGYLDQLVRGAAPSYDNLDNKLAIGHILTYAVESGQMAEVLLKVLVHGEAVAPADEA